jgi:hypothetical protein
VINVKYQINERIERFTARLVARDFIQIYRINFDETFAPIIRINSLRILLCFMTLEDIEAE